MKKFYYNILLSLFLYVFSFGFASAASVCSGDVCPYNEASCNSNSDCSAYGGCCAVDIYYSTEVQNYFNCVTNASSQTQRSACVKPTGSIIPNKCWPKEACEKGISYVIRRNSIVNGVCGEAKGYTTFIKSDINALKAANKFCSVGVLPSDPVLNLATKIWSWTCVGSSGGVTDSCSVTMPADVPVSSLKTYTDPSNKINGVCVSYSSALSLEPTNLCSAGTPGKVDLNSAKFTWKCFAKNGGVSADCEADAKAQDVVVIPAFDPYSSLENDPDVKDVNSINGTTSTGSSSIDTTSGGTVSDFPVIEQKSAIINSYNLLEKYASSCVIKFDSECEVFDQKFLDAVRANMSIQDAVKAGKLNGDWKVAKLVDPISPAIVYKEADTYKTGFTLSNIQKLRKARVLPVGMELAALCIVGKGKCANGYTYDGVGVDDNCVPSDNTECHRNKMSAVTLNQVLNGYSDCDSLSVVNKNGPFCHFVNPNWILKDPKYMCESGLKNGQLLYVTDTQSQSNIRYQNCPDVSTCLSEKNNGDCLSYGYCLREKNIWRFDLSADSCVSKNVGCTKYTYTIGDKKTTLGFIKQTTDASVCDSSNSGCRKYSVNKTGTGSSDWSRDLSDKIFLNGNIKSCESTNEGCTSFIRRDGANLIKNSSFEEYELSTNLTSKNALIWNVISAASPDITESVSLESSTDGTPVFNGSNALVLRRGATASSTGYVGYNLKPDYLVDVEPNKTYSLSYYVLGYNSSFTMDNLKNSIGAYVNIKEYSQNKTKLIATENNIIDIDAFKYVNNFVSSIWTRKTVIFKTSLDTYYLDIVPVLSQLNNSGDPATAIFDGLQLEEGSNVSDYKLYEDSKVNYLKKAPDYANCYSPSNNKDKVFCSSFIKSCDKKDVGCRRYEKKDNSDYWLPGKPTEENYCTSECKGYGLYKESGPSYDPVLSSNFQSLIPTTATQCDSSSSGCSEYKDLESNESNYYSSIKICLKETDSIGACKTTPFVGKTCSTDADCGDVSGDCVKAKANYVDYFTYTGSETSGYKLNVYRLLRTKACSAKLSDTCFSDADCVGNGSCVFNDSIYAPASAPSTSFDACNVSSYAAVNHNPDCREFHGPKNSTSLTNTDVNAEGYVLYYANMSQVIPVSDTDCKYYNIVAYQGMVDKTKCDSISPFDSSVRYKKDSSNNIVGCNIGVYTPDSVVCGKDKLNCREYKGTSISSETLFSDSFEDGDNGWSFNSAGGQVPSISTEDIFVNEHSVKIPHVSSASAFISKPLAGDFINIKEKSLYKVHLYAKNDSPTAALSSIEVRFVKEDFSVGFSSVKAINNDWKLITFDIFSSEDVLSDIQIMNKGIVDSVSTDVNAYVDYIVIEKSDSSYLIKDTWVTPVSCDNSVNNPTGVCDDQGVANEFCQKVPDKVCLTGNIGTVCTDGTGGTANNIAATCGNASDTCDYPNKICLMGDNKGNSCNSFKDCYLDPADNMSDDGSCSYTSNGYRLNLGKMIGCDEYLDPYGNDNFYVFNDLNLCSADKMGCDALYDTKNSKAYQKQEFNKNVDYSGMVSYYTFDDKDNVAKNDFSKNNINNTTIKVAYVSDGVFDGAALFDGANYISEDINPTLNPNLANTSNNNLTVLGWFKSSDSDGDIISSGSNYKVSLASGNVVCTIGGTTNLTVTSASDLNDGKWHNFICSYDGSNVRLFIDGELDDPSDAANVTFSNSTLLKIGGNYIGSIDDVRIYNKLFNSNDAYNAYSDYKDYYTVPADELGYYIVDSNYACDVRYKGCSAVGRSSDRYDAVGASYSTAYYVVDPDKFNSSGNYSTTGVYDGSMCKFSEEGCYSFTGGSGDTSYFKFPKNVCVYKTNVDVGISSDNGTTELKDGWFKYDVDNKVVSSVGCYLDQTISNLKRSNPSISSTDLAKQSKSSSNSYKISRASDCEYRKEPVVVKRTFETVASNITTRPKQTTYYVYSGFCAANNKTVCSSDSDCGVADYCLLSRTNIKCSAAEIIEGKDDCKPYGYDEDSGIIDEFSNKTIGLFTVCTAGDSNKMGKYCDSNSMCNTTSLSDGVCGAPWTVIGWFKKNSTTGCSDNGLECVGGASAGSACIKDADCGTGKCQSVINDTDYMRDYNDSVGVCNEPGCAEFIEPTERHCSTGNLDGYQCASNSDCGDNGVCTTDSVNGSKYCKASNPAKLVDRNGGSCVFDSDCGFGGSCVGNNTYSYIKNSKINSGNCNGTVSRESGCILFDDTSNSQMIFSSKMTYASVKNGVAVAAVTGDNSGGDSQKDSNMIIKVSRDRECSEWLTFDNPGSPLSSDLNPSTADKIGSCKKLSKDNKCDEFGAGWGSGTDTSILDSTFYVKQMKGNWSNEDFSGMAIPGKPSLSVTTGATSPDFWWRSGDANASNTSYVLKASTAVINNAICKSYPENDSPFNFEDKFAYEFCVSSDLGSTSKTAGGTIRCAKDSDGKYFTLDNDFITYNQYKNLVPRDYFKNVNTGITLPYKVTVNSAKMPSGVVYEASKNYYLYNIDNNQNCYYKKVNYKDVQSPKNQYIGKGLNLPDPICASGSSTNIACDSDALGATSSSLESKVSDYTSDDLKYKGYCAEYDYSHEIYYSGSGQYNCITWIPGFMNDK